MNFTVTPRVRHINKLSNILAALIDGKRCTVLTPDGTPHTGIINALSIEDGSRRNWLVKFSHLERDVFVKAE